MSRAASTSAATACAVSRDLHGCALGPEGRRVLAEHLVPSSAGRTAEQIAADLEDSVTLGEAVERGWFTVAEQRLIEGHASRDDLEVMGFAPAEIEDILEEQKGRR